MNTFLRLCAVGLFTVLTACTGLPEEQPYEQTEAYQRHLQPLETYKMSRKAPAPLVSAAPQYDPVPEEPVHETNIQPVTGSADGIFDDRLRK